METRRRRQRGRVGTDGRKDSSCRRRCAACALAPGASGLWTAFGICAGELSGIDVSLANTHPRHVAENLRHNVLVRCLCFSSKWFVLQNMNGILNILGVQEYSYEIYFEQSLYPGHAGKQCKVFGETGLPLGATEGIIGAEELEFRYRRYRQNRKFWRRRISDVEKLSPLIGHYTPRVKMVGHASTCTRYSADLGPPRRTDSSPKS